MVLLHNQAQSHENNMVWVNDQFFHYTKYCLDCLKPIPDYLSESRMYCKENLLYKQNCKAHHRTHLHSTGITFPSSRYDLKIASRINTLFKEKGTDITLEDINEMGIHLKKTLKQENHYHVIFFCFYGFTLKVIDLETYKIFKI